MQHDTSGGNRSLAPLLMAGTVVLVIVAVMAYRAGGTRSGAQAPETPPASPSTPADATPRPVASRPARVVFSPEALAARQQDLAQRRKDAQARVDRTQAAFANQYRTERTDPAWANAKEAELLRLSTSDQIRQLGIEARNLSADCRSSMCLVTADFPSMGAGDDWVILYMNNLGDKVPSASYKYVQRPDGTVTIQMYAQGRR